jgi:hypothetical protein
MAPEDVPVRNGDEGNCVKFPVLSTEKPAIIPWFVT